MSTSWLQPRSDRRPMVAGASMKSRQRDRAIALGLDGYCCRRPGSGTSLVTVAWCEKAPIPVVLHGSSLRGPSHSLSDGWQLTGDDGRVSARTCRRL